MIKTDSFQLKGIASSITLELYNMVVYILLHIVPKRESFRIIMVTLKCVTPAMKKHSIN